MDAGGGKREEILELDKMNPSEFESTYVDRVYTEIAPHFSETRYKPWPGVSKFVAGLEAGAVLLDVGCGNGKNTEINKELLTIGVDKNRELVTIAAGKARSSDFGLADNLRLPFRSGSVDSAISVAVIHHFSTKQRRQQAISEILRVLAPGGKAFIQVWAFEQERRKYERQDNFVEWKLKKRATGLTGDVYKRYYHLYKEGELLEDVTAAAGLLGTGIEILSEGFERDNWFVIVEKKSTIE